MSEFRRSQPETQKSPREKALASMKFHNEKSHALLLLRAEPGRFFENPTELAEAKARGVEKYGTESINKRPLEEQISILSELAHVDALYRDALRGIAISERDQRKAKDAVLSLVGAKQEQTNEQTHADATPKTVSTEEMMSLFLENSKKERANTNKRVSFRRPQRISSEHQGSHIDPEEHRKQKALIIAKSRLNEIKQRFAELSVIPDIKNRYNIQILKEKIVVQAVENNNARKERILEIETELVYLMNEYSDTSKAGTPIGAQQIEISQLRQELDNLKTTIENTENNDELSVARRMQTLKNYAKEIKQGRIVETPSFASTTQKLMTNMRINQPMLLAGHLGSGKTEVARHAAKLFMIENGVGFDADIFDVVADFQLLWEKISIIDEKSKTIAEKKLMDFVPALKKKMDSCGMREQSTEKMLQILKGEADIEDINTDFLYNKLEPEIYSGSEESTAYDLIGKIKLTGKSLDTLTPAELKDRMEKTREIMENLGATNIPDEEIRKILLDKAEITITAFQYGPLGRALKEGKPIIIDEINMIPAEVLGRINQTLLARVGSKTVLQENGEEPLVVKAGFAVIGTLNLGQQYEGIKEVNAAFKSRWIGHEVYYPPAEELYDLCLATLVRHDRTSLPPNFPIESMHKILDLVFAVTEIQDIFAQRSETVSYMSKAHSALPEPALLEKSVVSVRDMLRKIVQPWKTGGFSESMDKLIATNILAGEIFSVADQKLMTEIFLRYGFFDDWSHKQLKETGVRSVSEDELTVLKGEMARPEYEATNKEINEKRAKAKNNISIMTDALSRGVETR